MNNDISLTEDETITLDRHDGVLPKGGLLVKVYCHNMEKGKQLKQQILNNQAIVKALQKYYDQSDFEDADTAIDYLHIRPKLEEILSTTYHSKCLEGES